MGWTSGEFACRRPKLHFTASSQFCFSTSLWNNHPANYDLIWDEIGGCNEREDHNASSSLVLTGLGLFQKCQRTSQWNCSWGRQSETSETCKIDLHSQGKKLPKRLDGMTKAYLPQTFLAITWRNEHSFNFYSFAVDWLDITWLWLSERMVAK